MSIQVTEYKPIKYLQPYVELFWKGDFNVTRMTGFRQLVVPNGFLDLIIHLSDHHCDLPSDGRWSQSPDYTIIGLYTKPYEVRFSDLVNTFGIRFKPEGIYNLFGVPASLFSESYDDMELVLGQSFRNYCARMKEAPEIKQRLKLTEQYLLKQLEKNNSELNYVNYAAEMIRKSDEFNKIEEIPGKVYVSLRQLEREFKKKIGTTPKRYMRIARLNEVHKKLEENDELELTQVAFDCGYADQAHFIRDFKSIMGVNPTLFVKERDQFIVNYPS